MHRAEIFALIEIPSVSSGITEWEHGGGQLPPGEGAQNSLTKNILCLMNTQNEHDKVCSLSQQTFTVILVNLFRY